MSTVTVDLPESLKKRIEVLAAAEGYSVSQFLASAAGEKSAVVLTIDYLRREAAAGRRGDFEKYLAAVPAMPPPETDRLDWSTLASGGDGARPVTSQLASRIGSSISAVAAASFVSACRANCHQTSRASKTGSDGAG